MAYSRSRKRTYRKKRTYSKKKRSSVTANRKSIEGIQRSLRSDRNQYGLCHEARSSSFGDAVVPAMPALIASTYSPAWGNWGPDSSVAQSCGRVTVPSVHCGMQFTAYTELDPVHFTVYHVKLVPLSAADLIATQTRALTNVGTDTELQCRGNFQSTGGVASTNGFVRLNPRYFEVKKKWTFQLGGELAVSPGQQISTNMHDSIKNIEYTIPMGNQVLGSPNGEWTALKADAYKNENLNYILVFTDQSVLDTNSPSYNILMSTIVTAKE